MDQALRQQIRTEEVTPSVVGAAPMAPATAATIPPALELTDIHKNFGAFQALKKIALTVNKGEFVCFLGPSGCGKTTLLRIIAGLEVQTSGHILQSGRDISRLPPAERDYGIVFQSYALFPNLTIFDNVAYGLVNRRSARREITARVNELLKLVGLPDSGNKFPAQLSGGQQQRIALARAIATSPGLLLLDEPLSALDALERVRLRHEVRSLQQRLGITTIMVTHDQEEALSMADRIVVMNHGVIEQIGTPMEIYREPATPFVVDFVGKANVLEGQVIAGGKLKVGTHIFDCEQCTQTGRSVRAYLRPEDIVARPIDAGDPNVIDAQIDKVEFLGSYCLVRVSADGIPDPLTVYLSLNFLAELRLNVGSSLKLKILTERLRVFGA